jgi:hypothetical protein
VLKKNQNGFGHLLLFLLLIAVVGVIGFAGYRIFWDERNGSMLPSHSTSGQIVVYNKQASEQLTNGKCTGAGSVSIGPPMPVNQISFILPYGIVVGGHVTPIDHQYYNGLDPHALRDTYDVIAPANGTIVDIEHRGTKTNTPPHTVDIPSSDEYRIVMAHTCSFLTYVDLVTSLSDQVKSKLPTGWQPNGNSSGVDIPITKGEVLGHIGGQTLDFAVWDLSKPLTGFVNSADYTAEAWKQFTAPTSEYLDPSVKDQVTAKYVRSATPIDGKIDYDIDGKLIGNWFQVGTGGYHATSNTAQNYWAGHLSIAPDAIDPSVYVASIGNYSAYTTASTYQQDSNSSGAMQLILKTASPDPATVGTGTGAVKYELLQKHYILPSGQQWNNSSLATGIKIMPPSANDQIIATVIAQLTGTRTLKFEVFPGKTASQVTGFDTSAKTYTR